MHKHTLLVQIMLLKGYSLLLFHILQWVMSYVGDISFMGIRLLWSDKPLKKVLYDICF